MHVPRGSEEQQPSKLKVAGSNPAWSPLISKWHAGQHETKKHGANGRRLLSNPDRGRALECSLHARRCTEAIMLAHSFHPEIVVELTPYGHATHPPSAWSRAGSRSKSRG